MVWYGLSLLIASQIVVMLAQGLSLLVQLFRAFSTEQPSGAGPAPLGTILWIGWGVRGILPLSSAICFTFVPRSGPARTLAVIALAIGTSSLVFASWRSLTAPSLKSLQKDWEAKVQQNTADRERQFEKQLQEIERESEIQARAAMGDPEAQQAVQRLREDKRAKTEQQRKASEREFERMRVEGEKTARRWRLALEFLKMRGYVELILFILFLQAIARSLQAPILAEACLIPLILQVAAIVIELGLALLLGKPLSALYLENLPGQPAPPPTFLERWLKPIILAFFWFYTLFYAWINVQLFSKFRSLVAERV